MGHPHILSISIVCRLKGISFTSGDESFGCFPGYCCKSEVGVWVVNKGGKLAPLRGVSKLAGWRILW